MPYIKQATRNWINGSDCCQPNTAGELNYKIHTLLFNYLDSVCVNGINYATINEVLGVLEAVKQEFYRRVAIPYEDKKIKENGDVYPEKYLTKELEEN